MQEIDLKDITWPKHMFSVINEPVELRDPKKKILILIPSKDRNDLVFQCVDSIKLHTSAQITDVEVIIIDTGSTPECIEGLHRYTSVVNSHVKVTVVEHGYYNFAKNNNQAFREADGRSYDYVVFCNNDIRLLNDVLSHMLWAYENKENVGTVGARLHFGDGKIQHIGAFCQVQNDRASPGHYGFGKAITGSILEGCQAVPANTCALMMMPAKLFSRYYFCETYNECFEDVQLNLQVSIDGLINYCNLSAVAFHYESQTRNVDPKKEQKQMEDLRKLSRFVVANKNNTFIKEVCYA